MKTKTLLLAIVGLMATGLGAMAQGTAFTYQGRLNDGANPANGVYDLSFTLFGVNSGGSAVAGPISVAPTGVSNGLFTVMLDFGASAFTGADRWLQIGVRTNGSVAAYQVLTPRQPLTSTPYATRAANATSYTGAVSDGQLSGNIARLNANQTFSGTVNFANQSNTYTGTFSGNGAGMTNVPGAIPSQLVSGASILAQPNRAYDANSASLVTVTLPTNANVGDVVRVNGLGTGGWRVQFGSEQYIRGFEVGVAWTASGPDAQWASVASSADGAKLVAVPGKGQIHTSIDSGMSWMPQPYTSSWSGVASSADGSNLVAVARGDQIYTSADSGVTWTARPYTNEWSAVASSADGNKLVAVAGNDQVYTSTDSGATWTPRPYTNGWIAVASSADGNKLVALARLFESHDACIYTSGDSGVTWTPRPYTNTWRSVASSADGSKLVAVARGDQIYTSANSGVTWTPRPYTNQWQAVASSADGRKLVAMTLGHGHGMTLGQGIYTSRDSGVTWTLRPDNRAWGSVASSADGNKLVAIQAEDKGPIYTSSEIPLVGRQGESVALQYAGNGIWQPQTPPASTANLPYTSVARDADGNFDAGTITATSFVGNGEGLTGVARLAGGNNFVNDQFITEGSVFIDNNQSILAMNTSGFYEWFLWPRGEDNATYLNYGTAGFNIRNNEFTTTMFIQHNGNVGIGTAAPAAMLDVNGSANVGGGLSVSGMLSVSNGISGSGSALTGLNASQLTTGAVADARLSTNVSLLGPSIESSEIADGTIVNADIHAAAGIVDTKLATIATAGKVADSALSGNVARRSGGNTFIDDQIIKGGLYLQAGESINEGSVFMDNNRLIHARGTSGIWEGFLLPRAADDATYLTYGAAGFYIRNSQGATTMFMQPNGNVGIGTASPTSKLHVAGDAAFSGLVSATTFIGGGPGLTLLNAGNISLGTLADARLSANVALRSGGNTFTGNQNFTGGGAIITLDNGVDIYAKNTSGGVEGLLAGRWYDNATYFTYGSGGLIIRNNVGAQAMYVNSGGNVGIGTSSPQQQLHVIGNILASGTITGSSDRNRKEKFAPVNPAEILERVTTLPIQQWNYIGESTPHVGPMAQDFHAAFGVGMDDKTISMVDADGVALAAIQGLNEKVRNETTALRAENAELKARLEKLERLLNERSAK